MHKRYGSKIKRNEEKKKLDMSFSKLGDMCDLGVGRKKKSGRGFFTPPPFPLKDPVLPPPIPDYAPTDPDTCLIFC